MEVLFSMEYKRLMLIGAVLGCTLSLLWYAVHGAVERRIFTTRELEARLRSSFYVLGVRSVCVLAVAAATA